MDLEAWRNQDDAGAAAGILQGSSGQPFAL